MVLIILLFDVPVFSSHVTHSQAGKFRALPEDIRHNKSVLQAPTHHRFRAIFARLSPHGPLRQSLSPVLRENRFCSQDMDICIASL